MVFAIFPFTSRLWLLVGGVPDFTDETRDLWELGLLREISLDTKELTSSVLLLRDATDGAWSGIELKVNLAAIIYTVHENC